MNKTTFPISHSTFGGLIQLSDFNTNYPGGFKSKGSSVARRIANDLNFDRQCGRNLKTSSSITHIRTY